MLTDSASTILLGKLFQVLIVWAVNEYFLQLRSENPVSDWGPAGLD